MHPPPQPERLVMRKDEAVGNKKKMQVCLPKHNYKLAQQVPTGRFRPRKITNFQKMFKYSKYCRIMLIFFFKAP